MNRKQQVLNWQSALGAIALAVGVLGITKSPAQSMPAASDSLQIAQVGVRSRINSPTPLNLRPRTHIPSPNSRRSSDYYRHSRSRDRYYRDEYGYGHHHHHDRHHGHHRRRQNRGPVIIINPANSSYSRYTQDGYIRIIGK